MSFISQETLKNMRKKRAVELDLSQYVGEPKKLLVRPIPFFDAVALHDLNELAPGARVPKLVKALASASLDPSTLEPISEAELSALFSELDQGEAQQLLGELQKLAVRSTSGN
jgi:hypothetical protein